MLFWTNFWACLLGAVSIFTTSEFEDAVAFLGRHPDAWASIAALSITSAVSQLVLLFTVQRFGPLVLASITTIRQVSQRKLR